MQLNSVILEGKIKIISSPIIGFIDGVAELVTIECNSHNRTDEFDLILTGRMVERIKSNKEGDLLRAVGHLINKDDRTYLMVEHLETRKEGN